MSRPYEVLEHTADVGVRARGRTLEETFVNMAAGLMSLVVPDPESIRATEERRIEARAPDLEGLLVAWLSEFVYLIDAERFLVATIEDVFVASCEPEAGPGSKRGRPASRGPASWTAGAVVRGENIDVARHQLDTEIKGVSYHMVKVERERASETDSAGGAGWVAQAIFDI
ncbi:MAG: archease [Firmicutes bacterium]|nr:archease [Bacillota bacterium]MDH7495873.1 archease [Bacillota bacterium]